MRIQVLYQAAQVQRPDCASRDMVTHELID